jgi:hypothetical protein
MNPQTAQSDAALDRILTALRNTQPSRGLEQRITARIAQAQAEPLRDSLPARSWQLIAGRLAPTPRYALTAIALVALILFCLHYRPSPFVQPNTTTSIHSTASNPASTSNSPTPSSISNSLTPANTSTSLASANTSNSLASANTSNSLASANTSNSLTPAIAINASSNPRAEGPPYISVGRSPTYASTTTRGPEVRSIPSSAAPTDPDALALAETLAPSRPIAPMPLTAEEHLLVLATRQGQPLELAELETLRQPALQARAEAHQQAAIRNYIHSLLAPLAAAEAINPTPPTEDASIPQSSSR